MFKDAFENFEAEVNPQIWVQVQQQIPTTAVTPQASVTFSGVKTLLIAGVTAIAAITAAVVYKSEPKLNTLVESKDNPVDNKVEKTVAPVQSIEKVLPELIKENETQKVQPAPAPASTTVLKLPETTNESSANNDNQASEPLNTVTNQTKIKESEPVVEVINQDDKHENNLSSIQNTEAEKTKETEEIKDFNWGRISNTFTPNADGKNDVFKIHLPDANYFKATILNINGKILHEWEGENGFWDGKDAGGYDLPKGMYVYYIIATDTNGNTHKTKGSISILK
ncbi:MAG TPA: gliding motility-associated C-terminal domain-containing protein [Bacteroidia bacterium]|nr:gliding motility-associated C-terminal domain-containing protein [Bacteroidia bacterium]